MTILASHSFLLSQDALSVHLLIASSLLKDFVLYSILLIWSRKYIFLVIVVPVSAVTWQSVSMPL